MVAVDPILFLEECRRRGKHANDLDAAGREEIAEAVRARTASGRGDLRLDRLLREQGIAQGQLTTKQFRAMAASRMGAGEKAVAAAKIVETAVRVAFKGISLAQLGDRKVQCGTCDRGYRLKDGSLGCTVCGCSGRRDFENVRLRDPKYRCPHPKGPRFVEVES